MDQDWKIKGKKSTKDQAEITRYLQIYKKRRLKNVSQQDQLAKDIGAMSMEFKRKRIWTKNVQKVSLRYENAQKPYT